MFPYNLGMYQEGVRISCIRQFPVPLLTVAENLALTINEANLAEGQRQQQKITIRDP